MLTFDSVKTQVGKRAIFKLYEFNYMILQAYDFFNYLKKISVSYKLVVLTNGEYC